MLCWKWKSTKELEWHACRTAVLITVGLLLFFFNSTFCCQSVVLADRSTCSLVSLAKIEECFTKIKMAHNHCAYR